MSAALSRYANPAADVGHAGPSAPVHDDPRLDFVADLPRFAPSPPVATDGHRIRLLERDIEQRARMNRALREALADVLKLLDQAPPRTPADDQVIERATRVLTLGSLL